MSKYKKPNWYPDSDVIATKSGWVYTKNHNEVLNAIPHLDTKLEGELNAIPHLDTKLEGELTEPEDGPEPLITHVL